MQEFTRAGAHRRRPRLAPHRRAVYNVPASRGRFDVPHHFRRLTASRWRSPTSRPPSRLMVDIAALIEPGDLITLSGDLGAGKTTFARALIRHLAGDDTVEVPSPTFTLMQAYELPRFTLTHADLYRLSGPAELAELGFDGPERRRASRCWNGRTAPPDFCRPTGSTSPSRCRRSMGRTSAARASPATARFAARAERIAAIRALPRSRRLCRTPRAGASRATPRRALTSGSRSTARAIS